MPLTKFQKDLSQHIRADKNDGCIYVLCLAQADHWFAEIPDRLCCQVQMSDNTIQEVDNRKEATRQTRQVNQGRKVGQVTGRSWKVPPPPSRGRLHPKPHLNQHAQEAEADAEERTSRRLSKILK